MAASPGAKKDEKHEQGQGWSCAGTFRCMTPADWILSLVFEAPDGEFHLEPRPYHGGLGEALGLARRDAQACAFGRTFRGFAAIEASTESFTVDSAPRAQRSPQDPCRPLIELLTPHRVEDQGQLTAETPRHPVQLPGVEAIHWWALEGAFGMATQAGVALGRCSSTDATEAEGAARQLGSIISHQRQLFPVTAKALPFMVELIAAPQVTCRATLTSCLEVVALSAFEANDTMSNVLAWTARLVARHQAEAMAAHQQAAREVGLQLAELRPRLEALAEDAVVGQSINAMRPQLGK